MALSVPRLSPDGKKRVHRTDRLSAPGGFVAVASACLLRAVLLLRTEPVAVATMTRRMAASVQLLMTIWFMKFLLFYFLLELIGQLVIIKCCRSKMFAHLFFRRQGGDWRF